MSYSRETILSDITSVLGTLSEDWDYDGVITEQTDLVSEMGFESLDIVVLAASLQERYPQEIPFSAFFVALGERTSPALTVRQWVDFMDVHLNGPAGIVTEERSGV